MISFQLLFDLKKNCGVTLFSSQTIIGLAFSKSVSNRLKCVSVYRDYEVISDHDKITANISFPQQINFKQNQKWGFNLYLMDWASLLACWYIRKAFGLATCLWH